jgi:guanine deaminase
MMNYQTAIRGAFFDITQVCDNADAIAHHTRHLVDGLLFIQSGKILAQMTWQEGNNTLIPTKAIPTCVASCCYPVLSIPTSITRKRR